jgi:hypothetical protein
MTEQAKCKILEIFGYAPEDLNCANADTAMYELFEEDFYSDPMYIIELFISNCTEEDFAKLKSMIND